MNTPSPYHLDALAALAGRTPREGDALYRALLPVERAARRAAEAACNTQAGAARWDAASQRAGDRVREILGTLPPGFFVNSDPRGCALKIDSGEAPLGLTRDWGGDALLVP